MYIRGGGSSLELGVRYVRAHVAAVIWTCAYIVVAHFECMQEQKHTFRRHSSYFIGGGGPPAGILGGNHPPAPPLPPPLYISVVFT